VKPTLFLEGSYEFGSYRHECGWVTPLKVRRQAYHSFFAGAAGHTYGAGPVWSMRGNSGDYNCGYTWRQALAFPAAKQFSSIAQAFLRKNNWWQWIPDSSVIADLPGADESLKVGVTSAAGDMALVYFSDNSPTRVRNTMKRAAGIEWFDPRNGATTKTAEALLADEVREMRPPAGWEDAILILHARN
jgi:hypothetical protein